MQRFSGKILAKLPKDMDSQNILSEFERRQSRRRAIRREISQNICITNREKSVLMSAYLITGLEKSPIYTASKTMKEIINKDKNFVGLYDVLANHYTLSSNSNEYKLAYNKKICTESFNISPPLNKFTTKKMKENNLRMVGAIAAPADTNKTDDSLIVNNPKIGETSEYGIVMFYMCDILSGKIYRLIENENSFISLGLFTSEDTCATNCLRFALLNNEKIFNHNFLSAIHTFANQRTEQIIAHKKQINK
ncbi:MAG: hypothetical protein LBL75_04115 [Rickettsiales bacterium]|jgi:hypothetical protein|nr:hypothetical protein [Rickettsiales bacterium]